MDNNQQKIEKQEKKNIILHYFIPAIILFCVCICVGKAIQYEKEQLKKLNEQLAIAAEKSSVIEEQIKLLKEEREQIQREFVVDSGLKASIIFCFNDFENSAYGSLIQTMEHFEAPGVIVFRSDNMPGMNGSISVEQYKELLEKGWEGAIATENGKILYQYMAEPVIKQWKIYMNQMKIYFESNDLEFPSVYVAQEGELLTSVEEYFEEYGISVYTTIERNEENAVRFFADSKDELLEMGMMKAKYTYKNIENTLIRIQYSGDAMAMRFQTVKNSAPNNTNHNSVYRLKTYLAKIKEFDAVQLVTFHEYQDYIKKLTEENHEIVTQYNQRVEAIDEKIEQLKQEDEDNYEEAITSYRK